MMAWGGVKLICPLLDFFALNFCCLTDYEKVSYKRSLFLNKSYDVR